MQVFKKRGRTLARGDCGKSIVGLLALSPIDQLRVTNCERRVCVRSRIVRAFHAEEETIVKHVLAERAAALKHTDTKKKGKKSK